MPRHTAEQSELADLGMWTSINWHPMRIRTQFCERTGVPHRSRPIGGTRAGERVVGRPRRGQSAKLDRSLAAQASRASGVPLAFHSFHPRAVRQVKSPWAQAHGI